MNETVYIETKYKDTLFRMLFKEKSRLLELYNAIYKMSRPNVQKILYKNVQLVCLS